VQVVREDPKNRNLLFAGTEFGMFVSLDAGAHWETFMNGYPTVRTDDILVHPRDGDLVVASHGRSLWIADDITPLEQLTPALLAQDVALFDIRPAIAYLFDFRNDTDVGGDKRFEGENAPRGTAISYYLKNPAQGDVKLSIVNGAGQTLCTSTGPSSAGLHRIQWTLVTPMLGGGGRGGAGGAGGAGAGAGGGGPGFGNAGPPDNSCSANRTPSGNAAPLAAGSYVAKLTVNGRDYTKSFTVLEDVWLHER